MTKHIKKTALRFALMAAVVPALMGMVACSENTVPGQEEKNDSTAVALTDDTPSPASPRGHWLLPVRTPNGTEYAMQVENIERADGKLRVINLSDKGYNKMEMPMVHYTWLFQKGIGIGMSYQQDQPGAGYGFAMKQDGSMEKLGQFLVTSRFTNYQFLDDSTFVTSVGGQVSGNRNDGATFEFWSVKPTGIKLERTKTIWTEDITGTDEQITFSSFVNMGDGTFLTAMVRSSFRERGVDTGGSSVGDVKYPDSCWVARMDKDLNVLNVYKSDKLSYAAGQYRSQMFREVLKADDGTVYVFSNAFNEKTTKHAGALRIVNNANDFDANYYWDIQEAAGGYKFRRVWHAGDDKFLLELYNEYTPSILGVGHQFAIIDMSDKKLTWVSGLPAKGSIISGSESGGVPFARGGYVYLPITKVTEDASVYKIDVNTAVAKKIITIVGAEEVRSVGYLE